MDKKLEIISNFFELIPIENEEQCLSYLLIEDVCYTTIPAYLKLNAKKIKSKLFSLV